MSTPQRLKDKEYRNWVKCILSLTRMKEELHDYVDTGVRNLHSHLEHKIALPTGRCSSCTGKDVRRTKRNPLTWYITCRSNVCNRWLSEILSVHTDPHSHSINWKNADINQWPTNPYEIAKVYMPKGQDRIHNLPQELDAPAILSLLKYCTWFSKNIPNVQLLSDLIDVRNEVLHSGDLKVIDSNKDIWIDKMIQLLSDLNINGSAQSELNRIKCEDIDVSFRENEIQALQNLVSGLRSKFAELTGENASLQNVQTQQSEETTKLAEEMQELKKNYDKMETFLNNNPDINDIEITKNMTDFKKDIQEELSQIKVKVSSHDDRLETLDDRLEKHKEETQLQLKGVRRQLAALENKSGNNIQPIHQKVSGGATASSSSDGSVDYISSLRPYQKRDTWEYYIESAMAGKDIPTEAKKKHNSLCNKLDGMITKDSFQSMKRMAMTYLDPKQVEKANNMNELLHQLEVKRVLAVGEYDTLLELMNLAGIGIGIDDIRKTNTEIQTIIQSSIRAKARVKKGRGKATNAMRQITNKRKSKGKANVKVTSVKKKPVSKDPDTTDKSPLKETYQSIESLTLSLRSWKIRARLTMKCEVRFKRKKNAEGGFTQKKYFQFKVIDESGEIEGFAYDDAVDKFYGVLKMGKVFFISRATLKKASKKFNSTMHVCQIALNKNACIEPCQDTRDIPRYGIFAFKTIDKLKDSSPGELVDVLAVVKESGELGTVKTKKRKKTEKRDILLVDQSGKRVGLTLWGRDAKHFSSTENLVIALKGVMVSDWAGRSLTMLPKSQKFDNPKIKGVLKLRRWFINEGKKMDFTGFQ